MENTDGFITVKSKSRKFKKNNKQQGLDLEDHDFDPLLFRKRLHDAGLVFKDSDFGPELTTHLDKVSIESIVSYGIGHIGSSRIARAQLALLLHIRLHSSNGKPSQFGVDTNLFDPVLTLQEKSEISLHGINLITTNEECRRNVDSKTTLFYMPHCDKPMYENVLWANWNCKDMKRVLIFGNSFRLIGERTPTNVLRNTTPLLAKTIEKNVFREKPFKIDSVIDDDVFNDCSLTWFETDDGTNEDFWSRPEKSISCTPEELIAST